jgi:hypothetical protein
VVQRHGHQISITDKIDDSKVLELNRVEGSASDPNARIWPFKVMHGKQPYDTGEQDPGGQPCVWRRRHRVLEATYDYEKSIKAGMDYAGLPYSGKFGFIETRMNWFITHMVAPKEKAVPCRTATPARKRVAWRPSPTSTCPVATATAGSTSWGLAIAGAIGAGLDPRHGPHHHPSSQGSTKMSANASTSTNATSASGTGRRRC